MRKATIHLEKLRPEKLRPAAFLVLAMVVAGCGVKSVPGGTEGTLRAGSAPMGDIQITLFENAAGSLKAIGFGVTDLEGKFRLVTNGAQGTLWLPPGEYLCTLETAGSPVQIPDEYTRPETTPLSFTWSADDTELDLELPEL